MSAIECKVTDSICDVVDRNGKMYIGVCKVIELATLASLTTHSYLDQREMPGSDWSRAEARSGKAKEGRNLCPFQVGPS